MIYVSNESSMKKIYKKIFDEKLLLLYVANNGCISRGINWMDELDTFERVITLCARRKEKKRLRINYDYRCILEDIDNNSYFVDQCRYRRYGKDRWNTRPRRWNIQVPSILAHRYNNNRRAVRSET